MDKTIGEIRWNTFEIANTAYFQIECNYFRNN